MCKFITSLSLYVRATIQRMCYGFDAWTETFTITEKKREPGLCLLAIDSIIYSWS